MAVVDLSQSSDSRRFIQKIDATREVDVAYKCVSMAEAQELMEERKVQADVIMACGPMPMLRAIKRYAKEKGIKAYISLEERMACGVGACLGCVCRTTKKDHHSHVNNARICTDGPVFDAEDVDI